MIALPAAMAARKKLADLADLHTDAELNENSQFAEIREAIRTASTNIGAAITKRVHFYLALRQMLLDITQSGEARAPAIEHVYRWFAKTRVELPADASGMSLRLDMGSLFSPSAASGGGGFGSSVGGGGDWISQLSHRPPLIHSHRDGVPAHAAAAGGAAYPSGSVSHRPAATAPSAIRHASLERLSNIRTRNLLESHALRTGALLF